MKRILALIIIGLLCFSLFSIFSVQVKALPGSVPDVVCVPFHGEKPGVPHDAWVGKEIILKGTAHDKDGDGTMVAYKWDFGDGYSTDWISGVNPYIIEAKHTYTGTMADGTPYGAGKYFTAWLYVKDDEGLIGKDCYFIAIREKTLDVEVNVALDNGLWWLHKQQMRSSYGDGTEYGYWHSSYGYHVAFTAVATEAFELLGHLPSGDRSKDPYVETVQRGLNYLFNQFHTYSISQHSTYCPLGNPDLNGNGIGLACFSGEISRQIYESGMALMTISSSGTPNRIATTGTADVVGRAYKDIVQDMIDFMAWAQSDPYTGVYEGGWRYYANYGQSDNSVSQWPVIGMEAAERNFGSTGVAVPDFVRPELLKWLTYSQGADGGFGYTAPGNWENTAKTGAGCAMLYWAGVTVSDTRFQKALDFLNAHWYDTASSYTNFGDYYTMYAIMKGMRIPHPNIEFIGTHDWYAEYARYIVDEQNAYGGEYVVDHSWLGAREVKEVLATAWAMAVLTPTLVMPGPVADAGPDVDNFPPTIPIKFDASGSYHRDPAKSIVLYEWDFESDGLWDYGFGRFVYPTGRAGPYLYAGWLAGGPSMPPYQPGYYHLGQDMEANVGDNVYAIADGEIIYVSVSGWGEGNFGVLIKHWLNTGETFLALYGHVIPNSLELRRTVSGPVEPPIPVKAGEAFATIGPFNSIPHLHFGIHPGAEVPPSPWGRMPLDQWPNTNGFVDPLDWITTKSPLNPVPLYVRHAYPAYYKSDGSIDWDLTAKDYTATLRVTDNSDPPLQDTDTCIVHITPPPWKPIADPDGPYEGFAGAPIRLDGSQSFDPESKMYPPDHPWYETIAKYEWDLDNDGQFDDSTEIKPSWTWESPGTYSVGLKVTDSQPSGPGGTVGPLDVDIKYTTIIIKSARVVNLGIVPINTADEFIAHTSTYFTEIGEKITQYFLEVSYWTLYVNVEVYNDTNGDWLSVPQTADWYAIQGWREGFAPHAIDVADDIIDFRKYDYNEPHGKGIVAFVTARDIWREGAFVDYPEGLGYFDTEDGVKIDAIYMPETRFREEGRVIRGLAHEFGHALGKILVTSVYGKKDCTWFFPDLRGQRGYVDSRWCLMGDISQRLEFDIERVHMCSYTKEWLGWLAYKETEIGKTYTIIPLVKMSYGDDILRYSYRKPWWEAAPHFYIMELRTNSTDQSDWDTETLHRNALAFYQVDLRIDFPTCRPDTLNLAHKLTEPGVFSDPDAGITFKLNSITEQNAEVSIEKYKASKLKGASVTTSADILSAVSLILPHEAIAFIPLPDIDLHAYSDDGRHIGMNYETGEYEIQIPGAIASGDMFNGREWIFVPENVNVHFVVSAKDNKDFFDAFPEAWEFSDGIETFDLSFAYYDSDGNRWESAPITEQIKPGETIWHTPNITENPDGTYTTGLTPVTWEYIFEDPIRHTVLKISTDDRHFQFIAPDKEFLVKHDPYMKITSRTIVIIYKDWEIKIVTVAVDTKLDFCIAIAWDIQTGKRYFLIDKVGTE